jgi:hypothetical protein
VNVGIAEATESPSIIGIPQAAVNNALPHAQQGDSPPEIREVTG